MLVLILQSAQTLTDELATLEISLESLRSTANAAKADLIESQTQLINIHEALGSKLPKEWEDITSDLTKSRQEAFRKQVEEMKTIEETRTKAVIQLLLDCQHLIKELKLDQESSKYYSTLNEIPHTFVSEEDKALDKQILGSLIATDNKNHILKSKTQSPTCTGISASVLDKLSKRVADLSQERRCRKKYLGELGQAIASLWEKLRISEEEQITFTNSVKGLGMDTLEKGEKELERLTILKSKMIGKLINEAREKIKNLCEETNSNLDSFSAGKVEDEALFTDDLLADHEYQICILQSKADQMRPLFRYIEKREDIIKERMEYEELQKDSERLQQRGAALTKQLMKEEKMSKRIKKDLPKYTEMLKKKIKEWEKDHGEIFFYKGCSYLESMRKQENEWQIYKNNEIQIKLKKKQQGMITDKNASSSAQFIPLPGRKKVSVCKCHIHKYISI